MIFFNFFSKYKNYILFNKNLIISGVLAFFSGAIFTQLYSEYDQNNLRNSIVTLTIEYGVYIPLFALLYYIDNKDKYLDKLTNKKNNSLIKHDIIRLLTAFSISEIIFSVSKILIHYQLLQVSVEPYKASMIGSISTWIIFFIVINYSIKTVKLLEIITPV
ncbi:MAG TPA: hypothetical protein VJ697_15540 [Nitrososphaeraceae archaeon]|nr:hypothetical protein [Nitrososphaeraceae archaeon]